MEAKKVVGAFVGMVVRVIIALVVLYYLYHTAITAYSFGYRIFADLPCAIAPGRDIQVTVTDTMDNKEIAREFEKVGLVEDWKLFWVQIQLSEYKDDIQPAIILIPGREGSLGIGKANIQSAIERAVGADIL